MKKKIKSIQIALIIIIMIEFAAFSLFEVNENLNQETIIFSTGNAVDDSQSCTSDWQCSDWSPCLNGNRIRSCVDYNNCGVLDGRPLEIENCGSGCSPEWQCTDWNPEKCSEEEFQQRTCTDANNCGFIGGKPEEARSCSYRISYGWIVNIIIAIIFILIIMAAWLIIKKKKIDKEKTESYS